MRLAVMQPYVFPYLGYFQLIQAVDQFVFYDDVNFIKRGWIHRNHILVNQASHRFALPLSKASQHDRIDQVQLHAESYPAWRAKFMKTLEQSYRKAPYFESVFTLVKQTLPERATSVASLAVASVRAVCDYLSLGTECTLASTLTYDRTLKGPERILALCELFRADTYINPAGGRALYHADDFTQQGVDLRFIQSEPVTYSQLKPPFVPSLSIVDVLMFNAVPQVQDMLSHYTLSN